MSRSPLSVSPILASILRFVESLHFVPPDCWFGDNCSSLIQWLTGISVSTLYQSNLGWRMGNMKETEPVVCPSLSHLFIFWYAACIYVEWNRYVWTSCGIQWRYLLIQFQFYHMCGVQYAHIIKCPATLDQIVVFRHFCFSDHNMICWWFYVGGGRLSLRRG